MAYFPFFVDISEKKCLIIGGGEIAYRKVVVLLDYNPNILVVAPNIIPKLQKLQKPANKICLKYKPFNKDNLNDIDFAIVCTSDNQLNHSISILCKQRHIPVNVVDIKEDCSFIFPALIKDEDIVIGISTGGSSPTITQYLKNSFKQIMPNQIGKLTSRVGMFRNIIQQRVNSISIRNIIFKEMAQKAIKDNVLWEEQQVIELIDRKLEEYNGNNPNWNKSK